MKTKILSILLLSIVALHTVEAQSNKNVITGSRFTYPLLEKWIAEYKKVNPNFNVKINPRGGPETDSATLIINAHELAPSEVKPGFKTINVNRYALLTVANSKSDFAKQYAATGIKDKDLKKLFFEKWDPFAEEETKKKKDKAATQTITLYTREQIACAPTTFARHYGFEQKDLSGKGIAGDDKHLIFAILKDTNGVTYNNLGMIYDLNTRKVKAGLTIIPEDLNSNGKLDEEEKIFDNLDGLISKLETKSSDLIIGNINFTFPQDIETSNKDLHGFITWVLSEGKKYNHEFGFLDQDQASINKQLAILNSVSK